jgi:toxin YoeB
MYKINFDKVAEEQLKKLKSNRPLLKKLLEVLADIEQNPYSPNFKFERLKNNLAGFCSKRLSKGDRVVYKVIDGIIEVQIKSVKDHY